MIIYPGATILGGDTVIGRGAVSRRERPADAVGGAGETVTLKVQANRTELVFRITYWPFDDEFEIRNTRTITRLQRKQSDLAGALDRVRQHPLVVGADAAGLPRQDLAAVRREPLQPLVGLVVDVILLLDAELARLARVRRKLSVWLGALHPPTGQDYSSWNIGRMPGLVTDAGAAAGTRSGGRMTFRLWSALGPAP